MDITIQHPWFKRALGPLIPSRLFDQFFGEGLLEYDLLPLFSSTISPYYRQSLFRSVLESGISEVRVLALPSFAFFPFPVPPPAPLHLLLSRAGQRLQPLPGCEEDLQPAARPSRLPLLLPGQALAREKASF